MNSLYKKNVTLHLSWNELACKDEFKTPFPKEWYDRAVALGVLFEKIRAMYDKPIIVTSAYRTPEHNKRIGGAVNSQHVEGKALDLKPPRGITINQFYNDIKFRATDFKIGGIGKYRTFVHVDLRPLRSNGTIALWSGTGVKDDR